MSEPLSVHVWSDIACPWCFVGKRRFEAALEGFDGEVAIEYHSFELSPDTPVDFEGSAVDFLAKHKGMAKEQVTGMLAQMTELAAAEGLDYDFDAVKQTKTLLAHQAIHFALSQGKQLEYVERVFHAYFEQGVHVGRAEELIALATDVGLDGEQLRAALDSGEFADAVQSDIQTAREIGIQGVPFYVIDNKYAVSGAQSPEVFLSALQQAADAKVSA